MIVTWYAFIVAVVGLWQWFRGSLLGSVIAVLFFSLFGGGAAFIVAHASITPASFALLLLLGHVLLTLFRTRDAVALGVRTNGFLAWYCLYGAATAYILPRLFHGAIAVPPVAGGPPGIRFATYALHYTTQNLTAAIYLIGALVASVSAGAATTNPRSREALVTWSMIIAWLHIAFGVAGTLLTRLGETGILGLFRNAAYQQLSQLEEGYLRISGIFPEPATYAGFAFGWFALATELWLRDVSPRLTSATALALGLMLVASTSSSAYLAIALYTVVLMVRFLIAPRGVRGAKVIGVGFVLLTLLAATLATLALAPSMAGAAGRIFAEVTFGKVETISGRERLFQAAAALKAFGATWGLGIGPGSFRSSSFLLAILGSTGVIGLVAFLGHVVSILKPLSSETYRATAGRDESIATATAWAACMGLLPAMVSAPTPVPGYVFAMLGGLALGWRYRRARRLPEPAS